MTELLGKNYIRKNTKTYLEVHFGQKVAGPVEIWIQLEEDCVQGMVGDHDGSDGKNVANVGIVQNSRKKMSKIQKNVQK